MAKLPSPLLVQAVVDAFSESGATAICVSQVGRQPRKFFVQSGQTSFDLWVYIWTLTHGGGAARPKDEYRIQLTGVIPPLQLNPTGPTILIGYEPSCQCFAGFDLSRHKTFSMKSPSIQININALHKALQDGFSFVTKGNKEIAIGFRPDQILVYSLHANQLHAQGADAKMVSLLSKAAALQPIQNVEIEQVAKERQRLLNTLSRLSRDSAFRRKVIIAYDRRCAVTGIQLKLIDAAHILPVGAEGSHDEVNNGLCLSPTYHRAYDRGLIYLDNELMMRINQTQEQELVALSLHGGLHELKSCLDRPIRLPADKRQWPSLAMIQKANKFRGIEVKC